MKNSQKHLLINVPVFLQEFKQDMEFDTKILDNNEVMIDNQFIGKINGLKLELDLKREL